MKIGQKLLRLVLAINISVMFLFSVGCDEATQKEVGEIASKSLESTPGEIEKYILLDTPAYSAEFKYTDEDKKQGLSRGKVFVDKNKVRIESIDKEGDKLVYILNKETNKDYIFSPSQPDKVAASEGFGEKFLLFVGGVKREVVGEETIEGKSYTKYKLISISSGLNGLVSKGIESVGGDFYLLADKKTNIPYRLTLGTSPTTHELVNVKIGPQSPQLFIPPTEKTINEDVKKASKEAIAEGNKKLKEMQKEIEKEVKEINENSKEAK